MEAKRQRDNAIKMIDSLSSTKRFDLLAVWTSPLCCGIHFGKEGERQGGKSLFRSVAMQLNLPRGGGSF